jgi:hypothetical protein
MIVGVSADAQAAKPSVFSPIDRVVCDRKARACYDRQGASVAITKAHLGEEAAAALQRRITKAGKRWDPNRFVLSNGVVCIVAEQACYTQAGTSEVDAMTTKALFGSR